MPKQATMPERPYDFLHAWSVAEIATDAIPSEETLREAGQALHAIDEFVMEPIRRAIKTVAAHDEPQSVDYADIGRLLVFVDHIRSSCGYILEDAAWVEVLAREELAGFAAGIYPDRVDPERFATLRRSHGLDVVMH